MNTWDTDQALFAAELRDSQSIRESASISSSRPVWVAGAPGRLDIMGGIAEYSGSLVFEQTIAEGTLVAVQTREDSKVVIHSLDEFGKASLDISDLKPGRGPDPYANIRKHFSESRTPWAAYIAGVIPVLMAEKGWPFKTGFTFVVRSTVPVGKGVSSSAALEVATMRAFLAAINKKMAQDEFPVLCQIVENQVAGAPCGLMDQITSSFGKQNMLLPILCQPANRSTSVAIPKGVSFIGLDSGLGHEVGGDDYSAVRCAAFMGYSIIAKALGLKTRTIGPGKITISDPRYNGYLANISPSVFKSLYQDNLPVKLKGHDFLKTYKGITDPVTSVEPNRIYPVRAAAHHPTEENHRVKTFVKLTHDYAKSRDEDCLLLMGELMYQSHESYSACGLGSSATDRIVEAARELGPKKGIYGAKITGGGSGGTVALLIQGPHQPKLQALRRAAAGNREVPGLAFVGSSPGAFSVPPIQVKL